MSGKRATLLGRPRERATLGGWLNFAEKLYAREKLALGQVATNAHDEALYLLLTVLGLPLDSEADVLKKKLTAAQGAAVEDILRRRALEHVPAAYLTREAWLGGQRFYVDERVIIPRSYFVEIIEQQLDGWLRKPAAVRRVTDVCTGSGCLAILLAQHFPKAVVDAVDLSADALEVAKINVAEHGLKRRVKLWASDVFDAVPAVKYDVILSNPPYEPSAHVDQQAPEFAAEPRMAHDGGKDGLKIIRKLLRQARTRLTDEGIVLIEVGGLIAAMDREFAALEPHWLHTEDGANCVCVIHAARLATWRG
ncbi:MAG: 50S ribosomal protein L3 N(5)-glutamine methyltransferase [Verrucomicrobia bacterium]|nr:50S ribosomal protein L3 N(5)-glutamine methyltransferase [Verrucomicrobiota bacterium]